MNPTLVTEQALSAAAIAAGASWAVIASSFEQDLQQVISNALLRAQQMAAGQLSLEEAQDLIQSESRQQFVLTQEAVEEKQIIAEAAINAAIGVVWNAVRASVSAA